MSARKPRFTAAERAILDPLAVRCIVAVVELSRAKDRADLAERRGAVAHDRAITRYCDAAVAARLAGKAFARALRKIQGAK